MNREPGCDTVIMLHSDWNGSVCEVAEMAIQRCNCKIHGLAYPMANDGHIHLGKIPHLVPSHRRTEIN